ncbi:RBBP9/YdeN family alpha/beta hydrolase [Rhodovulum strictum]|uniref:Alpha/beta hydrolase n=1 Tax=Rhodovulum strictum TaxID=58314 RepID=A0A844BN27_9RHOB|nr:alpha/beta hydrolase [Rhodovulum strictum]MRH21367.1 alpha/beta hydrolase [Rhodovulum strictum]
MPRTLLIPGLDGSPDPHWQAWWQANDPTALIINQEDWAVATPEAWESTVAGAVLHNPGSIVVAHSLSCLVVARLLAKWPQLEIAGALLVAPAIPHRSTRLAGFVDLPRSAFPMPTTVVASRNDPWMPFSVAFDLADDWGAAFVDLGDAGHINVASGFGPWPLGLELRDSLARRAGAPLRPAPRRTAVPAQRWAF